MALYEEELEIITIGKLLKKNLDIPVYQRPYRWSVDSVNTLFDDIYDAFENNKKEYRLGSVILHKEEEKDKENKHVYNIVDGQQRVTTLAILLYVLDELKEDDYKQEEKIEVKYEILNKNYSTLSSSAIFYNYNFLKNRVRELNGEKKGYTEYLLENCTMVQVVTDNEQEAFQFFDSQNTRGKELAPHDLLKAYHLREMSQENEKEKIEIISKWEALKEDSLKDLFKVYLYPLTRWYKGRDGLGYSSSKIKYFKGINKSDIFNFAIYHKASNLFVEEFNKGDTNRLITSKKLNQFQLTQPLIGGKRFFHYVFHYYYLLEKIKEEITKIFLSDEEALPDKRSGDKYIKNLFLATSLFFVDRFGIDSLDELAIKYLYIWAYSLRLVMQSVYNETINKYAKGEHERINKGINIFEEISEMESPEKIKLINLNEVTVEKIIDKHKKKYGKICENLSEWNGWGLK